MTLIPMRCPLISIPTSTVFSRSLLPGSVFPALTFFLLLLSGAATATAGQLAIIIDDLGYNPTLDRRSVELPGEFTLAVLPFTPHSTAMAHQAHARGKELILHAPMSNTRNIALGKGGLTGDMDRAAFERMLTRMFDDVPFIKGVNNHMGSQLTQEREPMEWLMDALATRDLYFIDSRTSADSVALQTAQQYRIPSLKRDVFLDNSRNQASIRAQLVKALTLAQTQGWAVAIGHPYPETLAVLEHIGPLLSQYGIQLVSVSRLLADRGDIAPKRVRGYCPAPPLLLWRRIQHNASPEKHAEVFEFQNLVISNGGYHANSIYPFMWNGLIIR